jgi:hypothetical protein
MIALRDNLPVVQFSDGSILAFDRLWLIASLGVAADRAGYKKWWLAPHVTESVTNFLEQDFSENTITIARLEKAVQSVLQVIGYGDVADHFRALVPPTRISLAELARDAGHGYELVFFDLLRSRMREAMESRVERLEITDAHRGIKMLRSAKTWRRDCSGLLDEVVGFIRCELNASQPEGGVHLQLT